MTGGRASRPTSEGCFMSDENKKIHEPEIPPDRELEHKESGQIEPTKSVQAPLPSEPAHDDD